MSEEKNETEQTKTKTVEFDGVTWTVQLTGDKLRITDNNGLVRHVSNGHLTTGVYLAGALHRVDLSQRHPVELLQRLPHRELPTIVLGDADLTKGNVEWFQ